MFKQFISQKRVPDETLVLFKKVIETELKLFAEKISKTNNDICLEDILKFIPEVLETPIQDKIIEEYRNISKFKYKCELDRFSLEDLREINKSLSLSSVGTKTELIDRIAIHKNLLNITEDDILKSKSYISKTKKRTSKKKTKSSDEEDSNIVSDSD
jgi:hypothetical protein